MLFPTPSEKRRVYKQKAFLFLAFMSLLVFTLVKLDPARSTLSSSYSPMWLWCLSNKAYYIQCKNLNVPWLAWLSGLSVGLWTKWWPVQFPVRAHAWFAGQVPSRGSARGNHKLMFLSLSFSLPSPLSKKNK